MNRIFAAAYNYAYTYYYRKAMVGCAAKKMRA